MSGSVAYHLRTNKAVERRIFFDLLAMLNSKFDIRNSTYIGFGGPMLEDFREAHQLLNFKKMISIESASAVYSRQQFNQPYGFIECKKCNSSEFIDSYSLDGNSIIWLDYGSFRDIEQQLEEIRTLIRKLRAGDILKITLIANPDNYYRAASDNNADRSAVQEKILQHLKGLIRTDYFPTGIRNDDMTMVGLPIVLSRALDNAIAIELKESTKNLIVPLTRFRYIDHAHQVFTYTGIIIDSGADPDALISDLNLRSWEFFSSTFDDIHEITMPALTHREKLYLDQTLPNVSEHEFIESLRVHEKASTSKALLKNYYKYYRFYPNFQRVNS